MGRTGKKRSESKCVKAENCRKKIEDSAAREEQIFASAVAAVFLCLLVYTITFVIIAAFQAVGRGVEPFVLSVLHKGSLDIVLLLILRRLAGVERILWAAPTAEIIALVTGIIMLSVFWKKSNMRYAQAR